MRIATTLLASCALLTCASTTAQNATPHCTGGPCELTIIMSAGCGSGIKVAPDPIRVAAGDKATVMTWVIRSPHWKFDKNGIDFQNMGPFAESKGAGTTTFTWTNKHAKGALAKGTFKYDINLVGPEGNCKLDPTVINQ